MVGFQPTVEAFFLFLVVDTLIVQGGVALGNITYKSTIITLAINYFEGMLISCLSPNATFALAVGPTVSVPLFCLSGFYVNLG